jgi:outer membrane protein OmpA-like peptidoglycan-associated protein
MRPEAVYMQKGEFKTDSRTSDSLVNATIEIKNTVTQQVTKINVDSVTGKYAFLVNLENDLILTVKKDGYAFESQYVSSKDTINTAPVTKNFELQKIQIGKPYTINDILFASNSYEINDTIKTVLTEFAEYLRLNSKINVALQGHTDNIGSDQDNLLLSENRAKTVFQFLVSRGINKTRLSFKGYGSTRPISSNNSEEGRSRNRRTVFVVMAK